MKQNADCLKTSFFLCPNPTALHAALGVELLPSNCCSLGFKTKCMPTLGTWMGKMVPSCAEKLSLGFLSRKYLMQTYLGEIYGGFQSTVIK